MAIFVKSHMRRGKHVRSYERVASVANRVASRMAKGATTHRFRQLSRLFHSLDAEATNIKMVNRAVRGKVKRLPAYYRYGRQG